MRPDNRGRRLALVALTAAAFVATAPRFALAQEGPSIDWQVGPTVAKLGDVAEIRVPEGYRFTGREGAQRVMELTQNPASGKELGILAPATRDSAHAWFVIFTFRNTGYVKDDEKDNLDAKKILEAISRGTEASNDVRRKRGWDPVHVVGWSKSPFYDPETNNLTWAILGRSGDSETDADQAINYSTRILGREGTMNVDLVVSPEQFEGTVAEFESIMSEFHYTAGHKYAEWREGDPIAEYGLTALIVGGAGAVALKSGLLAKLWKVIVLGVVAVVSAIKKFVTGLFGKKEDGGAPASG
jgi:uncharacterized membrane-anchored protein